MQTQTNDDLTRRVVLRVAVKLVTGYYGEIEEKQAEIERYIYGRFYYLGHKHDGQLPITYLYFLVEEHYSKAVIDRLASGLFGASETGAALFGLDTAE